MKGARETSRKARKAKIREDPKNPIIQWLIGDEAKAMLCPTGYRPLSKDPEVRRCVHRIAEMISSMTIMLMENTPKGDRRVKNKLSYRLDIAPELHMTRKTWVYTIVTQLLLYGNALSLPVYGENGYLERMRILDPSCASYQLTEESYIIWYKGQRFHPDELLHFVFNPDPQTPFWGEGFMPMIKDVVGNLLQAGATREGFLRSEWKPSLIISTQADSEELEDEESRNALLQSYTKTSKVGQPWLIPAGVITVETIKPLSLNDLALQDGITLDKRVLATALGMAPFMVGIGEFRRDAYNNTISGPVMSFAQILQQEMTAKLLYKPEWYLKFNAQSLIQYDMTEKQNFVMGMKAAAMMTGNEGRMQFDLEPSDAPGMDDFNLLENYIPISKSGKQKKLKDEANEKKEGEEDGDGDPK